MSEDGALRVRQWVAMPGGSCDMRLGTSVIEEASAVLKGSVGKPRASVILVEEGMGADVVERVRRQLASAGFSTERLATPASGSRSLDVAKAVFEGLDAARVTGDDLVVALGGPDALSLASYVCAQWCGGTSLVMVPSGKTALLEAVLCPRGIDVGGCELALSLRPCAKHVLFDFDVVAGADREDELMARVLMVVTAMCDSEKTFSRLWDRAQDICAGVPTVVVEQLQDTLKARGKILSSTALALRQSLEYGESFARALLRLVDGLAPSTARAEALRFQARLAAGEGHLEVDDVLAQDELLEMLELPLLEADVDPHELLDALRAERFLRSNRFLLGLPRALGRVRLATVTDELIGEHVAAWCASRATA